MPWMMKFEYEGEEYTATVTTNPIKDHLPMDNADEFNRAMVALGAVKKGEEIGNEEMAETGREALKEIGIPGKAL